MAVGEISEQAVQQALRDIRAGRSLAKSPLLQLDVVTLALRNEGLSDNRRTRQWQLGVSLEAAIQGALADRSGADRAEARSDADADPVEAVRRAFQVGRHDVEALAYLHLRYFTHVTDQLTVVEIAQRIGVTDRTLQNRLQLGYAILAEQLRACEAASSDALVCLVAPPERAPRGNLPLAGTSFVGREDELAQLRRLIATARLVSITGPGGAGKSRLALELAARAGNDYGDGTWLVDLASLPPASAVAEEVGAMFGLRRESAIRPEEAIAEHLREARALLILDNCEHVIEDCAMLASVLISRCGGVRVLATSREPLRLAGEAVFRIAPLSVPPIEPRGSADIDRLAECPAARLFEDRAASALPGFRLTAQNAASVAGICRGVDGIPLAIEMAAPLVRMMTPAQIADRMLGSLVDLGGGPRGTSPHHRTMRDTMEWSYGLLSQGEQTLLRRLSVFAGGWSLESAEEVCSGSGLARGDIVGLTGALIDKSLVTMDARAASARYGMLSTVRQFAAAQLEEGGAGPEWRSSHLAFFLALAEEAAPALDGPEPAEWLARLDMEHHNLTRAMDWALDDGQSQPGLRLAGALWRFWYLRGHWLEGQRALERALSTAGEIGDSPSAARVLTARGHMLSAAGDQAGAERWCEEALAMSRRLDDLPSMAAAHNTLGMIAHRKGEWASAEKSYAEGLAAYAAMGDKRGMSTALNNLGLVARWAGDDQAALARYEEALALSHQIGDRAGAAATQMNLAAILHARGDVDAAEDLCRRALALFVELGELRGSAMARHNLAGLADERGELDRARLLLEQSMAIRREMGDRMGVASSCTALASVCIEQHDPRSARELLAEGIEIYDALGDEVGVADALDGFARLAAERGEGRIAAVLAGSADALRQAGGVARPDHEQAALYEALASARSGLGEAPFAAAAAEGRSLTRAQAVAMARTLADRASASTDAS